jgi:hypothetical protein
MFNRPHHQRIAKILKALNSDLLQKTECYFAGGTAIALSLNEYRESVDIDFLCSSKEGYRLLRNVVSENSLGSLLNEPFKLVREVRTDRYAIRTFIEIDSTPIKIEFVREDRIEIEGSYNAILSVPMLSRQDMYAEKLLANADRGLDKFVKSRDIIDLAMMIDSWGNIPNEALNKTYKAYGDQIVKAFQKSVDLIKDKTYFRTCLESAHMDKDLVDKIPKILENQLLIMQKHSESG